MKNENYIVIHGWMVTELELSGNELMAYAIIYGFSQDGENKFTGSLKYLCNWLGCTKPTVIKALKNLVQKKLIDKEVVTINGVNFNHFSTLPGVKKFNQGGKEFLPGGGKEILPYNTNIDNTSNNKGKHIFENSPFFDRRHYLDEIQKRDSIKQIMSNHEIDFPHYYFSALEYSEQGGKKYKNWLSAIANWIRSDYQKGILKTKNDGPKNLLD